MKRLKGLHQTLIWVALMFQYGAHFKELHPPEKLLDIALVTKKSHNRLEQDLFTNYSRAQSPNEMFIDLSRQLGEPVPPDAMTQTKVFVRFHPLRLVYLDDKRQSFKLAFILQFNWNDTALKWDPSSYGNIERIHRPQSDMWVPPVFYANALDESKVKHLGFNDNVLQITNTGHVSWTVTDTAQFSCSIDVRFYPFDVQNCSVDLVLFQYQSTEVLLRTREEGEEPIRVNRLFNSGGTWKVLHFDCIETNLTAHKDGKQQSYGMVSFKLVLYRRQTYFLINIMLPLIFLAMTVPAVFLLPTESPVKIQMSFTGLLTYGVYLSSISGRLPQTSQQTCILQVYLAVLYGNSTTAVLLAVFVLRMRSMSPDIPVGPCIQRVVVAIRKLVCLKNTKMKIDRDQVTHSAKIAPAEDIERRYQNFLSSVKSEDIRTSVNDAQSCKTGQCDRELCCRGKDVFSIDMETVLSEPTLTWQQVAQTVDRLMFLWFFCSTIVLTLAVFFYLRSNHQNNSYTEENYVPSSCHEVQMELYN